MDTQAALEVIRQPTHPAQPEDTPISASEAHEVAGISYRQCDHWARRGWVVPSIDRGEGRWGRRQYSTSDVIRLDLLRHLAQSGVSTGVAGPAVAELVVPDADVRILWNLSGEPGPLQVVSAEDALAWIEGGGAWVIYNPRGVRAKLPHLSRHPLTEGSGTEGSGTEGSGTEGSGTEGSGTVNETEGRALTA
jgi:hypothetical protein